MLAKNFQVISKIKNTILSPSSLIKSKRSLNTITLKKMLKNVKCFFTDINAIIFPFSIVSKEKIDFRGKNGENYFHDLARKKPIMFIEKLSSVNRSSRLFSKLPRLESFLANSSIKTIINLMGAPDNDGRYPLEYFLCFISLYNIKYQDRSLKEYKDSMIIISKVEAIINSQWTRRPDWLEVKMLIVERNQISSCVDSLSVIWKQKTQEDFRECLKTDRGKELIRMAANNFRYDFRYDFRYRRYQYFDMCGMEIHKYTHGASYKYTHGASYKCSFFNDIDIEDKDVVKLYLMQSWNLLSRDVVDEYNQKFIQKVEFHTHKAAELGIDVIKLREQLIHSFRGDERRLGEIHKRMSKYNFWNSLEIINERGSLMQVVSLENRQDSAQISSAL